MKEIFRLFVSFLKIGSFTFGGGYAMIPAIRKEATEYRGWMNEEEMSDCIAVCQALPGMFAVNSAIYIGKKASGVGGAVAAALGMMLPAFLSILIIMLFLAQIENNPYVIGALEGIKAAAVALIAVTVWQMSRRLLDRKMAYIIAGLSFIIIIVLGASVLWALLLGAVAGWAEGLYCRRKGGKKE